MEWDKSIRSNSNGIKSRFTPPSLVMSSFVVCSLSLTSSAFTLLISSPLCSFSVKLWVIIWTCIHVHWRPFLFILHYDTISKYFDSPRIYVWWFSFLPFLFRKFLNTLYTGKCSCWDTARLQWTRTCGNSPIIVTGVGWHHLDLTSPQFWWKKTGISTN